MCVTAPTATISSCKLFVWVECITRVLLSVPANSYIITNMSSSISAATSRRTALIQRKLVIGTGVEKCNVKILVLNAGSSSQKSRLYEAGDSLPDVAPSPLWEADADWGQHQGTTTIHWPHFRKER